MWKGNKCHSPSLLLHLPRLSGLTAVVYQALTMVDVRTNGLTLRGSVLWTASKTWLSYSGEVMHREGNKEESSEGQWCLVYKWFGYQVLEF